MHRVEGMACSGIRDAAHPGQGSDRRRSLICVVLVLVAAAYIATPSSVQATTGGQPGIVLSKVALTIGEGSTATYTVALRTRPSGNVRITVWRTSYDIVFRRTARPLTFTPANWNIPRTVTLAAVHDDDARDGAVVLTHAASGGGYGGVPPVTLRVTVDDDDEVGIVLSKAELTIDEGGTAAYTVSLGTRPTGNVRITVWRSSYAVVFRRTPVPLTFTPANWNIPRTVTLKAVHDDDARDGAVVLTHAASGGGHGGVPPVTLRVTVADDDDARLSSLDLEGITLDEAFESNRTSYTATVEHAVNAVTITAANDDGTTLTMPRDDDAELPGVQVVLDEGVNVIEVQVTGGNGRARTYTVTVTRQSPAIVASLTDSPDMHVGRPFTVELRLSAFASISSTDMRDHAFTVTGGRIAGARRLTQRPAWVGGERRLLSDRWRLSVRPDGVGPVTLSLPASRPCDEPGAICTPSGLRVGNALDLTVRGPGDARLSLHPPSGPTPESAQRMLFTLRLSEAIDRDVIVCWRTVEATPPAPTERCPWGPSSARSGSATPGADYLPTSGFFVMESGQTGQELGIHLFDDSIDDDGETVALEIAHARVLDEDGSPGAAIDIHPSTAVGTIENRGGIPSAWLLRFGRTVAEQVVDAVRDRASAPRRPGFVARVAGHAVGGSACSGREGDPAAAVSIESSGPEAPHSAGRCEQGKSLPYWAPGSTAAWRAGDVLSPSSRELTAQETLAATSLALSSETAAQDGLVSLWMRGAVSRFDGEEDDVALDGEATSALLGADYAEERWDAGLVLSVSRGTGSYRGVDSGSTEASMTGLYPWGRYALGERTSLWGVAGYGAGDLTVTPQIGPAMNTDIDLALAALGVRSTLLVPGPVGGPGLEAISDVLGVRTRSESVEGMAASRAQATRLRAGLRGSWTYLYGTRAGTGAGAVKPSLEVGLRHDGGDAETGFGLELGGGLAWSDASLGLTGQVRAQGVVSHSDGALRAEGVSGALGWDPRPSSAIGPSLSLRSSLGASSSGAVADLFGTTTPEAVRARGDAPLEPSLEAALGYGLPAFGGRVVGVPEIGLGLSDDRRTYRLGWRLLPAAGYSGSVAWSGPGHFELSIVAARHDAAARAPEHAVGVRFNVRF